MTHRVSISPSQNAAWIGAARNASALMEEMANGGPFSVWYVGADTDTARAIEAALPPEATLGVAGRSLETIADTIEACLLDLSSQMGDAMGDPLAWDVGTLSDLSPYRGGAQLNAARCVQVMSILERGERNLLLVDDEHLGRVLCQAATDNGRTLSWAGDAPPSRRLMWGGLRARLSMVRHHAARRNAIRAARRARPVPWQDLKSCDVLILDWARADSYSPDGPVDFASNLERMPQILRGAGLKVGVIANPLSWLYPMAAIADNAASAADPVVMVDELLSWRGVLKGAWRTALYGGRNGVRLGCADTDISAIMDEERRKDLIRSQASRSYAYGDIAKALAAHGVAPKAIVYTFENQDWERTFVRGVRKHLPGSRLVGYQHCPFAKRMISFFPTPHHIRNNVIADALVVMGPFYERILTDRGFPKDRLCVGGSLRFEAMHALALRDRTQTREKTKTVLCATSIEYSESLNLVLKTAQAIQKVDGLKMIINFHPKVDEAFKDNIAREVRQCMGGDEHTVRLSEKPISALIRDVDAITYNNSGASFEALMNGVHAVFVSVDGALDYDKIPDETALRADSVNALATTLEAIVNDRAGDATPSDISVGGCIAPVDEAAIVRAVRGE